MIYLDNAATTLIKPDCVIEAVCGAMSHMGNSGRGSHGASLDAARTIYEAREAAARFFGFEDPTRVVFTSNIPSGRAGTGSNHRAGWKRRHYLLWGY